MITINKKNFPIYGIIIMISLIIGLLFNYYFLKKNNIDKKKTQLFLFLMFVYSFIGGILFDAIVNYDPNELKIGLSSYGGAIGVCICAIVFEKMDNSNRLYVKSAILSLPLIYSISKLACFFAGCCYGRPYSGLFSVVYTSGLNIPLVPVQLIETIVFWGLFGICYYNNQNDNIVPITIFLCAISKFTLDFLRYRDNNIFLSPNQIVSIVFIIISLIIILKKKIKKRGINDFL